MNCSDCQKEIDKLTAFNGRCGKCHGEHLKAAAKQISVEELRAESGRQNKVQKSNSGPEHRSPILYRTVLLTTETSHDLNIEKRLDIVSAEVVVGMNVFKDLFVGVRNITGGRSDTIQKALKDIRSQALDELKREAFNLEADAVVGVSLNYQDIGASGSTMLMLVATGTAVKLSAE